MPNIIANDGTNWRSTSSPVSTTALRAADKELEETEGQGPRAANEVKLHHTVVEGSEAGA